MAARPTGTVTFLFTDIEGSTRLWQQTPRDMSVALARHDDLLRAAIESHRGFVFKTVGDAFCAAFDTAADAVEATIDAQRAMLAEAWSLPRPIRVRAAIHSGEAEERDSDYFGPALNRVARLLSIGHGGQTLVSLVSAELVRDMLPESVELHDMGARRLKDLMRPETVYQLEAPGLRDEFPALKSIDLHPHNLPIQPTALIGREAEVAAIEHLVTSSDCRLVTLTGMGGMGKTRLALQVAANLLDRFEDGAFVVDLSPVDDPGLVVCAISHTLRLHHTGAKPLGELVADYLADKDMLLVLDNFEQVMEAGAHVVHLLGRCPRVRLLVTSREALHLRGERVFAVPPLTLPGREARTSLRAVTQYESVRLFIERSLAVRQDFAVDNDNAPAVAEICARLDGIPLAIELAASRTRLLSPQAILARLEHRLRLLTSGARDLPVRQRTLRTTIDWSYELMEPPARALFAVLSVFSAGFVLESAEAVVAVAPTAGGELLDRIESLVDKSLLRREETTGGEPRFHMLETLREYGQERLAPMGCAEDVRKAHAAHFLDLAIRTAPLLHTTEVKRRLDGLEREHANLREAYRFLMLTDPDGAMRLCSSLEFFWLARGHISEGRQKLENALAAPSHGPASARAEALLAAGTLAGRQGDMTGASAQLQESLERFAAQTDRNGMARARRELGMTHYRQNRLDEARSCFEAGQALAREAGDAVVAGACSCGLGIVEWRQRKDESAERLFREALTVFERHGELRLCAQSLGNLALVARRRGDAAGALELNLRSRGLLEEIGDAEALRVVYNNLGDLHARRGEAAEALASYARMEELAVRTGDRRMQNWAATGMAEAHIGLGDFAAADACAVRALRLARDLGTDVELGLAHSVSGRVRMHMGDPTGAATHLHQAVPLLDRAAVQDELEKARNALEQLSGAGTVGPERAS